MRNWKVPLLAALAICASPWALALDNPATVPNPNDPSVSQVYDEARAGHLQEARQMMDKVLANHPQSARAHYVAAELDADLKNYGEARQELQTAERITPGLPFANADAVAALRRQIGMAPAATGAVGSSALARPEVYHAARPFPWSMVLIIGAVVLAVWMLFRRRQQPAPYNPYAGGMPGAPMAPGMGPGPVVPPNAGFPNVVGGGMGSGIVGGLASGLAVGAGVAAGEELVRHAFDHGGSVPVERIEESQPPPDPNPDLGGPDFGINDAGGWDDGGGSSGGDDGSWT
jgi:hypothetical protein